MRATTPPAPWPSDRPLRVVGHRAVRASALAKVTGRARFASDIAPVGMLHAILLRARIPRGRVLRIDTAAAAMVPGVVRIVGPFDFPQPPGPLYPGSRSRPAIDAEVRFAGEEIGAVVAQTSAAALNAARLVRVDYEAHPAVLTMDDALAPDAPILGGESNIVSGVDTLACGDIDVGIAAADVVIEARYATAAQHHNALEPHGCVAAWQDDVLTLWDSNQGCHGIRERLAMVLGLPHNQVRVVSDYVGGGFGGKIHLKPYHVIAAQLARLTGRPVRLFMDRREEFIASHQRAPTARSIRLGATRDGRLTFIDQVVRGQAGPTDLFARNAAGAANGMRLHGCTNMRAEIRRVHTNTPPPIPFRGPTAAEDIFCLEQAIDEMAHALDLDPLEFRRRNIATVEPFARLPYAGNGLLACYERGAAAFGWRWRPPRRCGERDVVRGIGVGAVAYDGTLFEESHAEVAVRANGRIEVRVGLTEIGCGADTIFAQIAAEALDVPLRLIDTHFGDTHTTPRSIDSTNHSRTTTVVGPAVRAAAQALRRLLLEHGARLLQAAPDQVVQHGAAIAQRDDAGIAITFGEIAAATGGVVVGAGERERPPDGVFQAMFGAHFVEVEVDTGTGRVRVLRAVCAHDAGRVVNPLLAESQVHGGFLQGMGMALLEEPLVDPISGHLLNATMWAYRTPGFADLPASIRFVDGSVPDRSNSLGVKGLGEPPLIAAGAAIANAIFNATGARVRSYPITPDKVMAALAERSRA
ncbi:xanthine dehydrogenase family protein molybdopterin-binding subunit [Reyranella sp. CPCC 100927]|uniref:xanthine dehydrogenase family protein molybdopterin-binding subunit n=1 Tax=Reyranella sp. CPCC 100927 TaxID=2599616 RepID=UPI0011B54A07|nr:xanthine dehydrogenase family protein molybdopterin-binding subunit [Reyranella sp. CPCC 100927]TWS99441.1 xanthine dehydrogenase family protein molybdopterin-binding subunit [Reyranella sp. CPCC 100927]